MTTSLQQQLQRLAVPQTIALGDARTKASILFDRREAATKSRRIIYDIGLNGLQELIALNPSFQQFESTLFEETTMDLERAVEQSDVNRLLDRNIRKFLQHLSPYFLLRPASMCLEWLLRRFHVHEYNRADLLALALPYHETNVFVRVLQTLRIKKADVEWSWLRPLQKPGVAVPKSVLLNRAASDSAFLHFVCRTTLAALKELGSRAHLLQTQINFYASIVVGALENAPTIREWHISTVLPSLLKGLSSDVVDFVSAAFIISAQLMARTQLTSKLCNALVNRVAVIKFERLRSAAILLLIWIFDTQQIASPKFSDATLLTFVKQKWLTTMLATLTKDNVAIQALTAPLLKASVESIQSAHEESEAFKLFLERLLCDIELPIPTAQELINCFLNSFTAEADQFAASSSSASKMFKHDEEHNDGIIELDSDDEMPEARANFQVWYSGFLHKLERKYPTAFDLTIKEALKSDVEEGSNRSKALKMALCFRLKSFDKNATDIYESLYHHTASMRLYAIQRLLANLSDYQARPQNYQLLKECLADRICDDSELVVEAVLQLPTEDFIHILGHEKFVESLFNILYKIQLQNSAPGDQQQWAILKPKLVRHLTAKEVVENYDTNIILLSLMPLLFPDDSAPSSKNAIEEILQSALTQKIPFLKELKLCTSKKGKDFSASEFKKQFLDVISQSKHVPKVLELFKSVEAHGGEEFFKLSMHLAHFLMLITACLKETLTGAECLQVFNRVCSYCKRFRIKHLDTHDWGLMKRQELIPLQLFSDFLSTLIKHPQFDDDSLLNWEQINGNLQCFLSIFDLLAHEAFEQQSGQEKLEWSKMLKDLFDSTFKNAQAKIDFLANFYIYSELNLKLDNYAALRLRAFKIMNSVLKNNANKFNLTTAQVLKITISLNSTSQVTRDQALATLMVLQKCVQFDEHLKCFVHSLLERSLEISMDNEQYSLVLYTILKPTQKRQKQFLANRTLNEILEIVNAVTSLQYASFTAEILKTLKHVNGERMLADLIPLASQALDEVTTDGAVKLLQKPYSQIYQLVVERFDSSNIENVLVDTPEAWQFFEKIFNNYELFIPLETKLLPVPCVVLETLDEHIYEQMPFNTKTELIKLIINTIAIAENDTIFLAANRLLKKCELNCCALSEILENMYNMPKNIKRKSLVLASSTSTALKRESSQRSQQQVNTPVWKAGVVLLELLENKKKLTAADKLIPPLFELLKFCLEIDEQSAVEYTKQLTLSTLFHCCQICKVEGVDLQATLPKTTFRIDQIVQCVRATQNPQTQNNALLLLSHCAALFPQQVLHNIVDIFTFMGSSVVRHDDAFSFHIINKIIESIIPILVRNKSFAASSSASLSAPSSQSTESVNTLVIPVLKVFSDILLDVPEHRRLPLYTKLLHTLGAKQHLWAFLCVIFESHVIDDEKQRLLQRKLNTSISTPASAHTSNSDKVAKRIEIALELINAFAPQIVLETCIQLLIYIKNLPLSKEEIDLTKKLRVSTSVEATEITLFDVKCRTAKQLRHYKYIIMQFLSTVSNSVEFLRKIAMLSGEEELLEIKPFYQNFIIQTLSYAPIVNGAIEKCEDLSQVKFWKVILHHIHDVLDNAISLLSPDMFLVVIHGLMQHQLLSIRKKVIELLISKLQQRDAYFDSCDEKNFYNLIQPLGSIICGILHRDEAASTTSLTTSSSSGFSSPSMPSNELVYLQQTALIAIKLLSKLFALKHTEEFKSLLGNLIKITKKRASISKIVLATVILTMIEISSNLKAHSLAYLPKYMPLLIEVLQDQADLVRHQAPDNVCIAIITGIQKLFESLPLFLGPYIVEVIISLSSISTRIAAQQNDKDQRSATALHKITTIWTKIATEVPVRVLVPSCEKAYRKLMENTKTYVDIGVLMKLLCECIKHSTTVDLAAVQTELSTFFLHALEFRLHLLQINKSYKPERIAATENVIIDALVAWVLKLSESSFRPLYLQIYEWALQQAGATQKESMLTYFSLTNKIAEALKSLFVLFAGDFIDDAARLLDECNTTKSTIDAEEEHINNDLISAILSTLYNVFLHDSKGFITAQRFEILFTPIVDQLENRIVLENELLQQSLTMCIAQLAVTVSSDILWKQLNYQVLLKTRTNVPEVRILSFNVSVEIARKLGEDFTALLPETVPFIAELFEDENPRVEKNTRKSVQELESILGESLQKYL